MNKPRIGVIGAGRMGCKHLKACRNSSDILELIGFHDVDEVRGYQLSKELLIPFFKDIQELLDEIDALIIAVPTPLHHFYGILCAEQQKHILMEKPLCETTEEALELIDCCKNNQVLLQIGHIERFNSAFTILPQLLNNEEIFYMDFYRNNPYDGRKTDTDIVHDLMIHDLDLMNWLIDCKIDDIQAMGRKVLDPRNIDFCHALVSFKNGSMATLTASRLGAESKRELALYLRNSTIHVDFLSQSVDIIRGASRRILGDSGYDCSNMIEKVQIYKQDALISEIRAFIESITLNQRIVVDGQAALKALAQADYINTLTQSFQGI